MMFGIRHDNVLEKNPCRVVVGDLKTKLLPTKNGQALPSVDRPVETRLASHSSGPWSHSID
jgi:hypothetical protein